MLIEYNPAPSAVVGGKNTEPEIQMFYFHSFFLFIMIKNMLKGGKRAAPTWLLTVAR